MEKGEKGEESKSGRTKRSGRTNRLFCPMFFPLISRRNWTLENRCIFHWPRDARPGSIEPGKRARVLVTSFSPSRHSRVRPGWFEACPLSKVSGITVGLARENAALMRLFHAPLSSLLLIQPLPSLNEESGAALPRSIYGLSRSSIPADASVPIDSLPPSTFPLFYISRSIENFFRLRVWLKE